MNHHRFLTTNTPICIRPDLMRYEFIVANYALEGRCDVCDQLLLSHTIALMKEEGPLIMRPTHKEEVPNISIKSLIFGAFVGACIWFLSFVLYVTLR